MSDELERLTKEAAALDAEAAGQAAPEKEAAQPEARPDPAEETARELRGTLEMMRGFADANGYTEAVAVMTDEAIERNAAALTPVFVKYGWTVSALFGRWKEEAFAALVVVPWGIALVRAFARDHERKAADKAAPAE